MKSLLMPGALAVAVMMGLSSCVYPPPPPPPPPPLVAPAAVPFAAPVPYPPPGVYRRCAPGWHWVRSHRNPRGHWVRGHCAPNR